jgi:protoheme IX farnesyltransferase
VSAADAAALAPAARTGWRSRVHAYVGLTKPRIIELLLVTTVPAMVLADKGVPSPWLVLTVLFGGTLAAGGANTINCVCDRDIDEKMKRTHGRPLPLGLVTPEQALRFGIALEIIAFVWLWATTNLLAATLAVSATAFYVFVYTMWLKRSTPQNIVIGGAAGAFPPMIGWAAVSGTLTLESAALFLIIFLWTPPHFWALALYKQGDYGAAGIPMLPNVAGEQATKLQILLYSLVLAVSTFAPVYLGVAGTIYGVVAAVTGASLILLSWRLFRTRESVAMRRSARALFAYSLSYLFVIFLALLTDRFSVIVGWTA